MSYAHANTCTDKHMQSLGQFADRGGEKACKTLCDGLGRQANPGVWAACEAVTEAGFTPGWGMR